MAEVAGFVQCGSFRCPAGRTNLKPGEDPKRVGFHRESFHIEPCGLVRLAYGLIEKITPRGDG
jgi:hypothetical protein